MRTVTLHGKTFHLEGTLPKVGSKFPKCSVVNAELQSVEFDTLLKSKSVVLSVPSLDTPVCQKEARQFCLLLQAKNIPLFVVSMDLPFAQKRWCAAEGLDITLLSDFRDHAFGHSFGVRIQELGLLARAVFVVDGQGTIAYEELVPVISDEPNYEAALATL